MPNTPEPDKHPKEKQVPLQDIVLSNSWALQAILQYLEEIQPGARDRIWQHYEAMSKAAAEAKTQPSPEDDEEPDGEISNN